MKNVKYRGFLGKISLYFFQRPWRTAFLTTVIIVYGIVCSTLLMQREGFPAMNIPYAIGQVGYVVGDPVKVDNDIAKPLSDFVLRQDGVKSIKTTSDDNFVAFFIQYDDNVDAESFTQNIITKVKSENVLPKAAQFRADAAKMGFTERGDDVVVSFYNHRNQNASTQSLVSPAYGAQQFFRDQQLSMVKNVALLEPIENLRNPISGSMTRTQTKFERYGTIENGQPRFYHALAIGFIAKDNTDKLKLDSQISEAVEKYNNKNIQSDYRAVVSASYKPIINQQISELQKTLIEGLIAVLVIGTVIITFRASFITVVSMITVVLATFGALHIFGYGLNTIVLFTLILGLAMIVDDTIIVVEAIDKERVRSKNREQIVETAVRKVGKAMTAATVTAALSFAPLLFVGGVIGNFVRAVPITIIISLAASLLIALVLIPFLARFIMLRPKQLIHNKKHKKHELSSEIEAKIARFLSVPMLWAQKSRSKEISIGIMAILLSSIFIVGGIFLATKVKFNIFPATKDSNQLAISITFEEGGDIAKAEKTTDRATEIIGKTLGKNFISAANYGQANAKNAQFEVYLLDYSKRKITAPELSEKLELAFENFKGATISVSPIDIGPPASDFEARVEVDGDRKAATILVSDIAQYLQAATITRLDGSNVEFKKISIASPDQYVRSDGKSYVSVTASFEDDDTSTLINLTKASLEKQFDTKKITSYGLDKNSLTYDFGQEQESQNSFKTLLIALPALLFVIYIVLAFEFRSLIQPLLIFMAIPFSFFGISLGLYLTNNAFSFFAMLGFFALIGLSIKNTILLTDYANQARAEGRSYINAAHDALAERFRPLIATSLTAIVSLIPLALVSPFWQALCVVLICGLLSSTFLVITVFPYYYLGGEYLRIKSRELVRKGIKKWQTMDPWLS